MNEQQRSALRALPSVDALLRDPRVLEAAGSMPAPTIADIARSQQERARAAILTGDATAGEELVHALADELSALTAIEPVVVINGTGVVIQTNLGRAPVSSETAHAMATAAASYLPLETRLATGERGGRGEEVAALFRVLTGAEDALVVNNNAAAVTLVLAALAAGGEVVVSRGEAVEIGGGFRIPDVLRQSGARLVEVGTTNRTYARDYAAAISGDTAALLRVHASNFAILGFTAQPALAELATLARERGVLLIEDVGSGCLLETRDYGLAHEPTLAESIAAGVDVVCASGDKLLGGPQAGIILGRAEVVARVRRHPLARAMRADKTALAGLARTLRHYLLGDATERIPVWWSISRTPEWLRERAGSWRAALGAGEVIATESVVGGGSLPGKTLPSYGLALEAGGRSAETLARSLRLGEPHVFPRIVDDRVAIDARTVLPEQDAALLAALRTVLAD